MQTSEALTVTLKEIHWKLQSYFTLDEWSLCTFLENLR